jgi:hypothetical protein
MISWEVSDIADPKWNKRLLDTSLGSIHQTNEFAMYTKEVFNRKPQFLKFLNPNGEIVGQLLLHEYPRFEKKGISGKFFTKITGSKNKILRWKYGPIIFNPNLVDDICKSLYNFCIQPEHQKTIIIGTEFPLLAESLKNLKNPFIIKPWATFLINLSENLEVIWEKMDKHSAQKNIKRSENRGVTISEITDKDLFTIFKLIQKTKGEKETASFDNVKKMWHHLHNIGMHGFLAFYGNDPIGGIMASSFNGYINEFGIARTQKDSEAKLYSQDLLKWHLIKWGKNKNLKYYDLTGVNPNPSNQKEEGIYRYKQKWGGKLVNYNQISL